MNDMKKATTAFSIATAMNCEGCKTFADLHKFMDANELLPEAPSRDDDATDSEWEVIIEEHFGHCNDIMNMAENMVENG